MLEDHKRTGAYYAAVMQNRAQFVGKTVLDVGTGSGVLALFAAKAGARKVYAVEATDMAKHARRLVHANKARGLSTAPQPLADGMSRQVAAFDVHVRLLRQLDASAAPVQ